ncbi:MAG: gluconate 2-dehydrogenase subunit 3 family protein [Acidobacteria bacterium]|nr:gluconate 2-dehydrogenase subunit 3 family protein [Acidobacteriota bacterium]
MPRPTLFLLHDRGGSARSWDDVAAALDDRFEVVVLEPAGAGDGAAAWVAAQVREREPDEWLIAGHGTGGGIARIVTDWAERGEQGLIPPAGLVLVDASAGPDDAAVLRTPTAELGDPARDVLLEQPEEVARLLLDLASRVVGHPALAPAFARLIASDRVAARTRRAMLARLDVPGDDVPRALSPAQRALLTAVLARVVPQRGTDLDLAGRLDVELAAGQGDGWRFAELPPDAEAWRRGLDTIAAELPGFADLEATEQDTAVDRIAEGRIGSDADGLLTGARMALWFTDLQAAAVRMWLSHPAAQAWLRYDGFADGGDGPQKQGFTTTHAGEWETWQRDWRTGKELQA